MDSPASRQTVANFAVQAAVGTKSGVEKDQPDHGNKANRKIDLFFEVERKARMHRIMN